MQKISKDLTTDETVLLAVKYQSKRIADLPSSEITLHAKSLLIRISVITGWIIPDDEFFLNVLVSEFQKFISENYSDLNTDEIAYAFRTYGTGVKDWGKSMNLSLIDDPINKYLSIRKCLSELEERKTSPVNMLPPAKKDWKELCEFYYQQYLSKKSQIAFWPWEMYDEFVDVGMMAPDSYEDFTERAGSYLVVKKKQELAEEMTSERENIQSKLQSELYKLESGEESIKIQQWSKRFAIQYLYYKAQEAGYKNLFVKHAE